jgi:hypothetical protein
VTKGTQRESWETNLGSQGTLPKTSSPKRGQLTLSQGRMKKGDDNAVDDDENQRVTRSSDSDTVP